MQQNCETQINKLINLIMKRGKKDIARTILFDALLIIKKRTSKSPLLILRRAFSNITPVVTYIPTKRGSKTYNIPSAITNSRADYLTASWIIRGAKTRSGSIGKNTFANKLADELLDNANGTGFGVKKKEELYSTVRENRPFMRYN